MKKIVLATLVIASILFATSLVAFADIGPKPTLDVVVKNLNADYYYLDLLSRTVDYDDFNSKYPESYKELPIYKYNVNSWLATNIRSSTLWGELETVTGGQTYISHRYTYFGIPKEYKVIIQSQSGQLYVSTQVYNFSNYNMSITIDFNKDMVLVANPVKGFKLSGFVKPEVNRSRTLASALNQGIKVEIEGTKLSGLTNDKGYFEIPGIPENPAGYKIKISESGYLSRYINSAAFTGDMRINEETTPIDIWAGDILINSSQDGAINLSDIVTVARSFNSVAQESRYVKDYDFNSDGAINMADIIIIVKHFNTTTNSYPKCTVPLPIPTPALITVQGKVIWNDFEGGFYGVVCSDGTSYDIGNGLPGIENMVGANIEMTGYAHPDWATIHMDGIAFEIKSIKQLPTPTPVPTPTPKLVSGIGTVVWNEFEGGFYGVIMNGAKYDIGNTLPGKGSLAGAQIKISGYARPDMMSFHQWGIIFEVVSYELSTPIPGQKPTPTPTIARPDPRST